MGEPLFLDCCVVVSFLARAASAREPVPAMLLAQARFLSSPRGQYSARIPSVNGYCTLLGDPTHDHDLWDITYDTSH